jgi:hypothetical protein
MIKKLRNQPYAPKKRRKLPNGIKEEEKNNTCTETTNHANKQGINA